MNEDLWVHLLNRTDTRCPEWIWNTKLMPVGSSVSDCFLLCRVLGFATQEAGGEIE